MNTYDSPNIPDLSPLLEPPPPVYRAKHGRRARTPRGCLSKPQPHWRDQGRSADFKDRLRRWTEKLNAGKLSLPSEAARQLRRVNKLMQRGERRATKPTHYPWSGRA